MNKLEWLPEALAAAGIPQTKAIAELDAYHDVELGFWFLLDKESAVYNDYSLRVQFPARKVIPFARRVDCDDIAAVVISDHERQTGSTVRIHDGAMPGDEIRGDTVSLDDWLEQARKEAETE